MTVTDIVELALACYRQPLAHQRRLALTAPLPAGLEHLLVLAHGSADALADAACHCGAHPDEVQDAARFLIQQLCFARGADHYRTLGLEPGASVDQIKERHRRLIWLFHPDRGAGHETWTNGYAARLNDSWDTLSRAGTRERYDAWLASSASTPDVEDARKLPTAVPARRRWRDAGPIHSAQRCRWLPFLVLGGSTLVAVLVVGVGHLMRPTAGLLVYVAPAADLSVPAPDRALRTAELEWTQAQRERIAATLVAEQDQHFALLAQALDRESERLRIEGLREEQAALVRRGALATPLRTEPPRVPPASPLLVVPVARGNHAAPSTPAVDPTRDNSVVTDRDVENLVNRYTRAYQRADLNAVMALFAPGTRDRDGSDLRRGYAATFQAYMIRGLLLHDLRWDLHGDSASVFAGYELSLRQRNNGQLSQLAGTIRLELHKYADRVVIEAIDYQWRAN